MTLCERLKQDDKTRVIFCVVSNEAEIAYLATLETGLEIIKMVDDRMSGKPWLNMRVESLKGMSGATYDHIIITDIERFESLAQELVTAGANLDDISLCVGHRIKHRTIYHVIEAEPM